MPKPRISYQSESPSMNGMSAPRDPRYNAGASRFFFNVVTKVADYTVLESDFGTIFNNAGATANVTFTLPAVTNLPEGWWCAVFAATLAYNVAVASNGSSDNIITVNDIAADSVTLGTSNEKAGGGFMLVYDATNTKWMCFTITGETQTVTIA